MKHLEAGQVHCNGPTIHDLKQRKSSLQYPLGLTADRLCVLASCSGECYPS